MAALGLPWQNGGAGLDRGAWDKMAHAGDERGSIYEPFVEPEQSPVRNAGPLKSAMALDPRRRRPTLGLWTDGDLVRSSSPLRWKAGIQEV